MFKRTRYQHGSVELEERKKGPAVWVYRWWEEDINGKLLHRKLQIGDVETYPNESAAHAAADALRLTINTGSKHKSLQRTTISILWEHYSREELPRKALSTQDSYSMYAKNWIVPRWGNMQLDQIKTVEVERWLLATEAANGTQAKIKCVMSALFSHAVRWEFCGHNPISSGHSGRKWRKERAKYGSSCQFQAPKVAVEIDRRASGAGSDRARVPRSASRVPGCRTGNTARRTRRTPLDGLRFQQPGLRHPTFLLLASGRPPHRYKVGGFGPAAADAPWAQRWPSGVEITEPLQPARRLRLRFGEAQGSQATRSGRRVEKENPARVQKDWHYRRGLAYVPAHSGNDVSGDGRTSTHDPRLLAAQQPPRHEQIPAGDVEDQASGTRQVGRRLLACRIVTQNEPGPIGDAKQRIRNLEFASCAYRPLISPDPFGSGLVSD